MQTLLRDEQYPAGRAAVDFYFIEEDGGLFKSTLLYEPYFYLVCKVTCPSAPHLLLSRGSLISLFFCIQKGYESQVEEYLLKRFEGTILRLERQRKEDLKLVSLSRILCPYFVRLMALLLLCAAQSLAGLSPNRHSTRLPQRQRSFSRPQRTFARRSAKSGQDGRGRRVC